MLQHEFLTARARHYAAQARKAKWQARRARAAAWWWRNAGAILAIGWLAFGALLIGLIITAPVMSLPR